MHFLEGRALNAGRGIVLRPARRSDEAATLYEHCVRAILHGLRFGAHGLPLMGSGDWNDGMNLVGIQGKGESVWLGFFLYDVLTQFAELARRRGDDGVRSSVAAARRGSCAGIIERHAWDGAWYRRAYFDDGTPLGSAANPECQIDSIAQSWSVLSGAGDPRALAHGDGRASIGAWSAAMHGLIQLLDPPFDKSALNPGYIKGYVPGRARERRPVHPCGRLGGDGLRRARR